MIKTFLSKSFGSERAKEPSSGNTTQTRIDLDQIRTLIEFFPIGKKLRYYPEFQKEIVFDTFVIAYCVNGSFIYSGEAINHDSQGYPTAFRSGENEVRTPVSDLRLFQLLVPDTSDLEMKLDYQRRALIGRGRQFNKGNSISLISNAGTKGVSTVDTEVAKQVILPDGPYAQTKMVLLTPELHTLAVTDQRRKARTKICAPVAVSLPEGNLSGPCTIYDLSEDAMRIRMRDRDTTMPVMPRGSEVILDIDLGEAKRHYTIKGSVIRSSPETCAIKLEGLLKDGRLRNFDPLDLLELKTGLLNYGT
ncbi:MAG: PilZ domain-containing protein [Gammaproteobacteria bacterium]|nr:PilZ domain-containing protein [Gammaproteobacteria bacterium]MBU1978116.1 PilZ domain-containing protein [Gammaproteobacteria bacterium]